MKFDPLTNEQRHGQAPSAWMRAWVLDDKLKHGRKLQPVTMHKCLEDDVPLYVKADER